MQRHLSSLQSRWKWPANSLRSRGSELKKTTRTLLVQKRPHASLRCGYFAATLSISAQACATAVLGSLSPGIVAQPPLLT